MAMVDTSTPQQRHTVSHQGIEFDDMVVNVAFPLSYRKLVVEGHFHRELEKSIRPKHIRRNVVEIFWPESLVSVATSRRIGAQRYCSLNSCHDKMTHSEFQSHCHRLKHGVSRIKWSIKSFNMCSEREKNRTGTHIRSFLALRILQKVHAQVIRVNI